MAKSLKISFPKKCIGCELCVLEMQRHLGKVGFEGALIRILRKGKENSEFLEYSIDIDPRVNNLNVEQIKNSCPTGVFELVDEKNHGLIE